MPGDGERTFTLRAKVRLNGVPEVHGWSGTDLTLGCFASHNSTRRPCRRSHDSMNQVAQPGVQEDDRQRYQSYASRYAYGYGAI